MEEKGRRGKERKLEGKRRNCRRARRKSSSLRKRRDSLETVSSPPSTEPQFPHLHYRPSFTLSPSPSPSSHSFSDSTQLSFVLVMNCVVCLLGIFPFGTLVSTLGTHISTILHRRNYSMTLNEPARMLIFVREQNNEAKDSTEDTFADLFTRGFVCTSVGSVHMLCFSDRQEQLMPVYPALLALSVDDISPLCIFAVLIYV